MIGPPAIEAAPSWTCSVHSTCQRAKRNGRVASNVLSTTSVVQVERSVLSVCVCVIIVVIIKKNKTIKVGLVKNNFDEKPRRLLVTPRGG